MGIATASKIVSNRGHFDVTFEGGEFGVVINHSRFVWASATEVDGPGDPINGGAYVTVQQVVPLNDNKVMVRIWVDNVPVPIRVEVSAFVVT